MGFNAGSIIGQTSENNIPLPPKSQIKEVEVLNLSPKNQLSTKEIEVLLSLIKRTTFLGEDIEPLYNLVMKLQNQYIELTK